MAENIEILKGTSLWGDAWKRLLKNKLAVFGLIVLGLMIIAVAIGPAIIKWATGFTADYIPSSLEGGDLLRSMPPSVQHPMGTDDAGRDLLARVLQGGRISLAVGLISTIVSLIVGVSYGAIAGYLGGRIDNFMMRIVDIIYAIPYILIVIVLLNAFGGGNTVALVAGIPMLVVMIVGLIVFSAIAYYVYKIIFDEKNELSASSSTMLNIGFYALVIAGFIAVILASSSLNDAFLSQIGNWLGAKYTEYVNQSLSQILLLFFALGLVSWLTMARVVRGQILSLKNQEFVTAAKATGVSTMAIIFRHLVPNALGPVIVYATLTVPSVMLTEAFLSFLGLGVQAPYASWGSLAADGIKNISIFPWQMIFPGVTMALTLFSLNFIGDGLRDALDPQTRKF